MEDRGAVSTCNRPSSTVKPSDHRWIVWRHGRSEWLLGLQIDVSSCVI